MIRFKNNVLPVWFQWDGDEESLERAKATIIEDIKLNGLNHYTGFADVMDGPSDSERNWDGTADLNVTLEAAVSEESNSTEEVQETAPKAKSTSKKASTPNKGLPKGTPNMDKFSETANENTAS